MARIQWIDVLIAPLTWVERARGRRRLGLLGLYGLILGVGGVLVGREAVLWRLPAVRSIDLPQPRPRALADADNAMVLYQAAVQRIVRDDDLFRSLPKGVGLPWDWAAVDPRLHPWIEANRPALDLWLRATARPDAFLGGQNLDFGLVASPGPEDGVYDGLVTLGRLAAIEATRRLGAGDLPGAWTYHAALLRSVALVGRAAPRGTSLEIFVARRPIVPLAWLNHPALTVPLIRRAIADVDACLRLQTTPTDLARAEYFARRDALADPTNLLKWRESWLDEGIWYNHIPGAGWLTGFLRNEPKRSLKVLDLITLGELDQAERSRATGKILLTNSAYPIHAVDAASPDPLRRITPARLVEWVEDSNGRFVLTNNNPILLARFDRRQKLDQARFTLAERAFELDHGGDHATTYGDLAPAYVAAPPPGLKAGDPLPGS